MRATQRGRGTGERKASSWDREQRKRQIPGSHSPVEPMSLDLPRSPPHKGSSASQCYQFEDQALNSSYSRTGGAGVSPGSPEAAVSLDCGHPTCCPLGSNAPDSCSSGLGDWRPQLCPWLWDGLPSWAPGLVLHLVSACRAPASTPAGFYHCFCSRGRDIRSNGSFMFFLFKCQMVGL